MSTRFVPHPEWILPAGQSRRLDRETIGQFGIDGFTLMEVAGTHIARHLLERTRHTRKGLVLCGKGNNAGDALVAARYLIQNGRPVTLHFLSGTDGLSPDAAKNLELIRRISEEDDQAASLRTTEGWENGGPDLSEFDFVLDGMLGTGLNSDLREPYKAAVKAINRSALPVYAVDVPTGLHADRGRPLGAAVKATETFTCGTLKPGLYLGDGPEHAGRITFCDLPFPNYLKKKEGVDTFLIRRHWVGERVRRTARHKYDGGVVYILGGSEGLTGAALMSARSAWKTGAGAVIWIAPRGLLKRVEGRHPQIITRPVGKPDDLHYERIHAGEVTSIISGKKGTVLLGPGLGRAPETVAFVRTLLPELNEDLVIDADGLRALSDGETGKPEGASWILTPHPGELGDLLGEPAGEDHERLGRVRRYARTHGLTLLSKGNPSITGTSDGHCYFTEYDTRVFSRAGFGDVLSGKIAACRALGHTPLQSCCIAMLDGIERVHQLKAEDQRYIPEPLDLI